MANRLTVLIPCKNERLNIRPCIESVRKIADELLVADSGSVDGTLEIARSIGVNRIIEREYVHSADFKNWAIPQAEHEWVLVVDADERVTEPLAAEIRRIVDAPPCEFDAYWIGRRNHYLGYPIKRCGWKKDRVIRLFRRDICRYRQRWVHAEIEIDPSRVGHLQHKMLHYTTWSTDDYQEKLNRYANWGARNYQDQGRVPHLWAVFFAAPFRFIQLYFLRLGFLDGIPGLQVCTYAAFYSFLKQAKLWEMEYARAQPDPEAEHSAAFPADTECGSDFGQVGGAASSCGPRQKDVA